MPGFTLCEKVLDFCGMGSAAQDRPLTVKLKRKPVLKPQVRTWNYWSLIFSERNTLLNALSKLRSFCGATAIM